MDEVRVDPQRDASNHRRLPVLDAVVDHTVRVHSLEECRVSSPAVADQDASSPDTVDDEVRERLGVTPLHGEEPTFLAVAPPRRSSPPAR